MKWQVHQDRDKEDPKIDSYTISLHPTRGGWNTDSGYHGYGLPKELAQWICDILNKIDEKPPYINDKYGYSWIKNEYNMKNE